MKLIDIRPIENDTEEDRMLNKYFRSPICEGFVEVGEDKFILPNNFDENCLQEYYDKEVSDDTILIACHPKTGSSWLQETIWLIENNLDYDKLLKCTPFERCNFFDAGKIKPDLIEKRLTEIKNGTTLDKIQEYLTQPEDVQLIKTHFHWPLLPNQIRGGTKKPKIFVPIRNPHDVCISYYHFSKLAMGYTGNFDEFCQLFIAGRLPWGPYWKNIFSYWEQRHRSNVMIVKYREMKENYPLVIKETATFLGKTITDEEAQKLANFLSFENMKNHPALNRENEFDLFQTSMGLLVERTPFIRNGKEGGYKAVMSPELITKFDEWVEKNIAGTGLTF